MNNKSQHLKQVKAPKKASPILIEINEASDRFQTYDNSAEIQKTQNIQSIYNTI